MGIWYTTREVVKAAADIKESARKNDQVDRAIESASRAVEGFLRRRFYPLTATRYFDFPDACGSPPWRLDLSEHTLISADTVVSGGDTISSADYFLEPANDGPPYEYIDIDLASGAAFNSADGTFQRSTAITGTFGWSLSSLPAGALAEALDGSETAVDVNGAAAAKLGVGSIVFCESERMTVTDRAMMDTTVNSGGAMTNATNDVDIPVADGTVFSVGEVILIDSERMLIVDIAGNTLLVQRAYDGTTLAAHNTASDIYASRRLTVTRGALGTTAATHSDATALTVWEVPGLVEELTVAYALTTLGQRQAGYARVVGSGDNQVEASGRGLNAIKMDARDLYGRVRVGAV